MSDVTGRGLALVLERLASVGGAAASTAAFEGHPALLPRYASLVWLMPQEIRDDLGVDVRLAPRPMASYTPVFRDGKASGLVVERPEGRATRNSFIALTGGGREYDVWCSFYGEVAAMARAVARSGGEAAVAGGGRRGHVPSPGAQADRSPGVPGTRATLLDRVV